MANTPSTRNKRQISVSIDRELVDLADKVASENKTSRSEVISSCLEELARSRKEQAMIEYYRTMSPEHEEFLEKASPVIDEIVKGWSE